MSELYHECGVAAVYHLPGGLPARFALSKVPSKFRGWCRGCSWIFRIAASFRPA